MFRSPYHRNVSFRPQAATPVPLDLVSLATPVVSALSSQIVPLAAACMVLLPIFIGIRLVPKLIRRFAR